MGKTLPPFSQLIEAERRRWASFKRTWYPLYLPITLLTHMDPPDPDRTPAPLYAPYISLDT
jgi:hypothetical protein